MRQKKNSNSCVVRKKIHNPPPPPPPPFKLNGRSLIRANVPNYEQLKTDIKSKA